MGIVFPKPPDGEDDAVYYAADLSRLAPKQLGDVEEDDESLLEDEQPVSATLEDLGRTIERRWIELGAEPPFGHHGGRPSRARRRRSRTARARPGRRAAARAVPRRSTRDFKPDRSSTGIQLLVTPLGTGAGSHLLPRCCSAHGVSCGGCSPRSSRTRSCASSRDPGADAAQLVRTLFNSWKAMFSRGGTRLSLKQLAGLYGELTILHRLLDSVSRSAGCSGAAHCGSRMISASPDSRARGEDHAQHRGPSRPYQRRGAVARAGRRTPPSCALPSRRAELVRHECAGARGGTDRHRPPGTAVSAARGVRIPRGTRRGIRRPHVRGCRPASLRGQRRVSATRPPNLSRTSDSAGSRRLQLHARPCGSDHSTVAGDSARHPPRLYGLPNDSRLVQPTGPSPRRDQGRGDQEPARTPDLDPLTVLVREAAQNSWDARDPDAADRSGSRWPSTRCVPAAPTLGVSS